MNEPTSKARRWSVFAIAAVLAIVFGAFGARADSVEAKSVTWTNYDVTLTLNPDGGYHVAERQVISFSGGPFTAGTANIPLTRVDGIGNVTVSELTGAGAVSNAYRFVPWRSYAERPSTYSWTTTGNQVDIGWGFTSVSFDSRTFLLEYDVQGALRVYPNATPPNQQIWWTAIGSDVTNIASVSRASMTIILPQAVKPSDAIVSGPGPTDPVAHSSDGKTWTWETSNLTSGATLEVRLQIPPVVDAGVPAWQQADDAHRVAQDKASQRTAALNVIFLGIGLALAALGSIGLYALWYVRGRDPHVGLVAEFLANPPDDLPAGAVGVLTDERVDSRDIVASVVDLARRGVIRMDETGGDGAARDYSLTLIQPDASLAPFEKTLITAVFGSDLKPNQTIKLSEARSRYAAVSSQVERQLYQEVVDRGYFSTSPESTRERWKHTSTVLLVAVLVAGAIGLATLGGTIAFLWFAIAVAAALTLVLRKLSSALPARTEKGAEAVAKWRAFKRYLGDINKYEKVDEAKAIFEKNLAFAVAFGQDESYVSSFLAVGAPLPEWFGSSSGGPVVIGNLGGYGRRRGGFNQWGTMGGPGGGGWIAGGPSDGASGGGVDIPSLQEASDSAGRGLQGGSDSFMDMLNKAAKAFGESSGGSGGGGFGGGGSSGGSSGGGGRGFS